MDQVRGLVDKDGNVYYVEVPNDVDANSVEEILLGAQDGIVKLIAYCLKSENIYRLPDNTPVPTGGTSFAFKKKLHITKQMPEVSQDEIGAILKGLLDSARNFKFNKVKLTQFEGKPVFQDNKGYYIKREKPCVMCGKTIDGTQRLSMRGEEFTRAQMFEPLDKRVVRYRPGSVNLVCGNCAPVHIDPVLHRGGTITDKKDDSVPVLLLKGDPPVPEIPLQPVQEVVEKPTKKPDTNRTSEALRKILKREDMTPEMFKGYVLGVLETLEG